MRHLPRSGRYFRVADPAWKDPLDGGYAQSVGGRWNPPGSFPVVYLNRTVGVARANVRWRLRGFPYGPEQLRAGEGPDLVSTDVDEDRFVDILTGAGCVAAGLPATYTLRTDGTEVPHRDCQPIGQATWDSGEPGIACRSAAVPRLPYGEELAWFPRSLNSLPLRDRRPFDDWFW